MLTILEIRYWILEGENMMDRTCGTGSCGSYDGRKFLTTEERVEMLDDYKKWLDSESKGVEEAIARLKKAK